MADTPTESAVKNNGQQVSSGMVKPGDIVIEEIYLNTVTGVALDLKPFFVEINIYEDIFSPTLHGNIVIRDAVNLIGRTPIIGDELLTINVRTPFQEVPAQDDFFNTIHKTFAVYAIKDRKLNNDREQYYQLFFCSVEASADNIIRISEKFSGTTSELADRIFTDHLSIPRIINSKEALVHDKSSDKNTPLFISDAPHKSYVTFVPPMWSPIQCLNWLAKRSIGANLDSPTYLFFETTKAFYFASVESLITTQIESNSFFSDYVYHPNLDELQTTSALSRGYSTVEAIQFLTNLDVLQSQDLGHFASTVFNFNLIKKEYTAYTYDHGFNFDKYNHMEDYNIATDESNTNIFSLNKEKKYNMIFPINVLRSGEGKMFISTVNPGVLDSTEDSVDLRPETFIPQRNSALMDLTTLRLQLTVSGRTDAEVGTLIKFYYPSVGEKPGSTGESFVWDLLITGIYMITAIHHQITPLSHKMFLEIAKDSYSIPLYDVEETGGESESPSGAPTETPPTNESGNTTPAADNSTQSSRPVGSGGIIGDSIAVGVGGRAGSGAVTSATVGWNSERIARTYAGRGGSDYTVISMGSNDVGFPNARTADNASALRESIKNQTRKVIWILPYNRDIASRIQGVASRYGDRVVDLKEFPSNDGLHPASYVTVWQRVNQLIGS